MFDITKYKIKDNETVDEYIYRICSNKSAIGTWQDVADILNRELHFNYTESKYRKTYQNFCKVLNDNIDKIFEDDEYVKEIKKHTRELEKERKKLQTEKVEYNRYLRETARDELLIEKICQAIENLPKLTIPKKIPSDSSDKAYVLCFGDEHVGTEFEIKDLFDNVINKYSPEIFEERMWKLFYKVSDIIKKENIKTLHIYEFGDFSDGVLRASQLMKLRYGVVESTLKYANFIAEWLNKLSEEVNIVFQMVVDANHTQLRMINQPKGTFKDENMSKVVKNFIEHRLENNPNFKMISNPTGYIFDNLVGFNILGLHGEVSNMNKTIKELSYIYNVKIDYLMGGHLHHSRVEEVGFNSEVINVPSIIGVDEYSLSLNKCSNPSSKLFVFEKDNGKIIDYTFNLK